MSQATHTPTAPTRWYGSLFVYEVEAQVEGEWRTVARFESLAEALPWIERNVEAQWRLSKVAE